MDITFRRAAAGDFGDVWQIIVEAKQVMAAQGRRQWTEGYPAPATIKGDIASGEAEKLATSYKRLLNVFKSDAAMSATGITIPIINALLKKSKIDETDEIMKITRQTLKTSRDSTLAQLLDNIDRQLSVIKSKIKAAK